MNGTEVKAGEVVLVPAITPEDVVAKIDHVEICKCVHKSGRIFRWAILTMKNGSIVTGEPSIMVSVERDDQKVAEKVAVFNAQDKVYALLEYQGLEDVANGRKTYDKLSLVTPEGDPESETSS